MPNGKKLILFHLLYYILVAGIYTATLYCVYLMLKVMGVNPATIVVVALGFLFLAVPIVIAVAMRFSLFRWYMDPIAAVEFPLFLYVSMVISQTKHSSSVRNAILMVNNDLNDDGGSGWLFFAGLFLFGLLASFSIARKNGQSVSYRLLARLVRRSAE